MGPLVNAKMVNGPCADEAQLFCVPYFFFEDVGLYFKGLVPWPDNRKYANLVADGFTAAPNTVKHDWGQIISLAAFDAQEM